MTQFFPMVQTHTMDFGAYLKRRQGYAFFISSPMFSGTEVITVSAPENTMLPDIGAPSRVLNQYSGKQWYISDQDRVASAQGGPLVDGSYTFSIQAEKNTHTVVLEHRNSFISGPQNIRIDESESYVDLNWVSDSRANTSWIFAFPIETKDILKDLIAVSSVMHLGDSYRFEKSVLKPGKYKVAIRSNQLWESGVFWGFQSEAWSVSSQEFAVK